MSTTETTPNPPSRHASLLYGNNQRKHSVRTAARAVDPAQPRPDAPVFLEEPLFLQGLSHGTAAMGGTARPNSAQTKASLQQLGLQALRGGGTAGEGSTNLGRKRPVGDTADSLTTTTTTATNSPEQEQAGATAAGRQAKKAKTTAQRTGAGAPFSTKNPNALPTTNTTTEATTTTDGSKKRSTKRADRTERQEKLAAESALWRAKYKKAFPSFTFYFDAIDEATKAQLGVQVKKLGASVDQFFSKKVTHVVTSRAVPAQSNKENVDSPAVSTSKMGGQVESAVGKAKKHSGRSPKSYSLPNGQKLRPHAGDLDKNPFIDSQDILSKAVDFKLKIWHLDKLQLILSRINSHSPNKHDLANQRNPSLPSLLRDEQLFGTRERDPFVPRSDMHYFGPNKYYLLVEDSTGEHRPIVIQEYDKPRKTEDPAWPILYGGVEGRSGFYKYDGAPIVYPQRVRPDAAARPIAPLPGQKQNVNPNAEGSGKLMAGFSTTAARAVGAPNLRRAISLQNVPRAGTSKVVEPSAPLERENKHAAPGGIHRRDSYIAASGNSQIITSTTGTSTRSGAAMQPGQGKGGAVDKRLAVLANRTVSVSMARTGAAKDSAGERPTKGMRRSVSVDGGIAKKFELKEEPKKPGYCENCRIKYDDFKTHVVSSKHRRFALNKKNWVDLDGLLEQIARRVVPTESLLPPSPSSAASSSPGRSIEDSGYFEAEALDLDCDNSDGTAEDEARYGKDAQSDMDEGDDRPI
ncbi:hypothetical protein JCM10212_003138 [Sporobolomyces blumeae]